MSRHHRRPDRQRLATAPLFSAGSKQKLVCGLVRRLREADLGDF